MILSVKAKFYALAAAAALLKYLETAHALVFPPRSLCIRYSSLEGTVLIDSETAVNLELVSNVNPCSPLPMEHRLTPCCPDRSSTRPPSSIFSDFSTAATLRWPLVW